MSYIAENSTGSATLFTYVEGPFCSSLALRSPSALVRSYLTLLNLPPTHFSGEIGRQTMSFPTLGSHGPLSNMDIFVIVSLTLSDSVCAENRIGG